MKKPIPTYTTQPAESIMGIALRQLACERRWTEIRDMNAAAFPDMVGTDYYPVGTVITMPEVNLKRQAEMVVDIAWWRKQEKIRVEGFAIVQTDPMYVKMNERYSGA